MEDIPFAIFFVSKKKFQAINKRVFCHLKTSPYLLVKEFSACFSRDILPIFLEIFCLFVFLYQVFMDTMYFYRLIS